MRDNSPYIEVIDSTLNLKKQAVQQYAKQWIAKSFGSSKAVVDLDDPGAGTIIIKFQFDTNVSTGDAKVGSIKMSNKATMQIDCRDKKIRIRTSNFREAIDMTRLNIPITEYYNTLDELLQKGKTIEEISNIETYRMLILSVQDLSRDLIKFIKQSAKDEF